MLATALDSRTLTCYSTDNTSEISLKRSGIKKSLTSFLTLLKFNHGLSDETVGSYYTGVKSLISFTGDIQAGQLTEDMINGWLQYLSQTNHERSTIFTYGVGVRQFLAYLKENSLCDLDPEVIKPMRRKDKPKFGLSVEEVETVLSACADQREELIIRLLYTTGLRVSEFCSLTRSRHKGIAFRLVGKGGKSREVYCDRETYYLLLSYLRSREDDHDALILGRHGKGSIAPEQVRALCRRLSDRSGIKVTPHLLRYSYATRMVLNGANLRVIQTLLGHSNLATTERYTRLIKPEVKEQYVKYF